MHSFSICFDDSTLHPASTPSPFSTPQAFATSESPHHRCTKPSAMWGAAPAPSPHANPTATANSSSSRTKPSFTRSSHCDGGKHNNYHQYVPLTIQHSIPTPQLQTVEATYIQQLQPRLNYTYIHHHLKNKLSHCHQQKQAITKTGFASIWCKIRRKHLPLRLRSITQAQCFRDQQTAWNTMVNLSSNTRRRFDTFDTTKQLMKHSTASPAIYALHKMTHNIAPTHQRTARKSLATILTKRKLPVPKGVAPLFTFPLGHSNFQSDVRQFLRECVSKHRHQTIPFHPPSTKVVFRRHPQVQQVLHNWRTAHH